MSCRNSKLGNHIDQMESYHVPEKATTVKCLDIPTQHYRLTFERPPPTFHSGLPLRDSCCISHKATTQSIQDRRGAPNHLSINDPTVLMRYARQLPMPQRLLSRYKELPTAPPEQLSPSDSVQQECFKPVPRRGILVNPSQRVMSHHADSEVDPAYVELRKKKGRGVVIVSPEECWQDVDLSPAAVDNVVQKSLSKAEEQSIVAQVQKQRKRICWREEVVGPVVVALFIVALICLVIGVLAFSVMA